jgi:hypothetical protein
MKYLFLDDERMPRDVTWIYIGGVGAGNTDWQIVRNLQSAKDWVMKNGFPDVISFDHDLGEQHYYGNYEDGNTGYDFAKWLIEYDMDTHTMPENFKFTVHSLNPIGGENIRQLLNNYIRQK